MSKGPSRHTLTLVLTIIYIYRCIVIKLSYDYKLRRVTALGQVCTQSFALRHFWMNKVVVTEQASSEDRLTSPSTSKTLRCLTTSVKSTHQSFCSQLWTRRHLQSARWLHKYIDEEILDPGIYLITGYGRRYSYINDKLANTSINLDGNKIWIFENHKIFIRIYFNIIQFIDEPCGRTQAAAAKFHV